MRSLKKLVVEGMVIFACFWDSLELWYEEIPKMITQSITMGIRMRS